MLVNVMFHVPVISMTPSCPVLCWIFTRFETRSNLTRNHENYCQIPRSCGDFCTGKHLNEIMKTIQRFFRGHVFLLFNIDTQVIESLTEEDDIIIDDVIEKTNKLSDLTDRITNYFGGPEYNTPRETMLGDMCHFLSGTVEEILVTMTTKACRVSAPFSFLIKRCELI